MTLAPLVLRGNGAVGRSAIGADSRQGEGEHHVENRDGTLRVRERWLARTWLLVGFMSVWSAGALTAVASTLRRCAVGHVDAPGCVVFLVFGSAIALAVLVSLLRKRRWVEATPDGLRDVRLVWGTRTIPYAAIRGTGLTYARSDGSLRLSVVAECASVRLRGRQDGWPRLVAELLQRVPGLELAMPDVLAPRVRALAGGEPRPTRLDLPDAPP